MENLESNLSELTDWEIEEPLRKKAASLYSESMPYHNFEHVEKTLARAREIVLNCTKEGLTIDAQVVYLSILFHDAGYHEDNQKMGFATKEEYSADLAEKTLSEFGLDEKIIARIKTVILGTNQDGQFTTTEAMVVRAADLANLAGDYQDFYENNLHLKQECEILSGQTISWEDWKKQTKKTIEFYLGQDIHLTSSYYDDEGNSVFHKQARANLARFLEEPPPV